MAITFPPVVDQDAVYRLLQLDEAARSELDNIDSFNFNIFHVRESTQQEELVAIVTTILAREKIFDELPLEKDKFIPCIKKI